ncbi:MAG TPA: SPOR domain-containing protein [Bacteroidales bacterium]|nr:SPOR domain-containing protein [Bacteroidales bacterium]
MLSLIFAIAVSGCRAKEMVIPEAPTPAPRGTIEVQPEIPPVPTREERFTFVSPDDQVIHEANQFFIILGSFQVLRNANLFVETLSARGFESVILVSETGMHRVSIGSFTDESVARTRVNHIRTNYPEHQDAWLLIRRR